MAPGRAGIGKSALFPAPSDTQALGKFHGPAIGPRASYRRGEHLWEGKCWAARQLGWEGRGGQGHAP